jgi:hypothetical protein
MDQISQLQIVQPWEDPLYCYAIIAVQCKTESIGAHVLATTQLTLGPQLRNFSPKAGLVVIHEDSMFLRYIVCTMC